MADKNTHIVECETHGIVAEVPSLANAKIQRAAHLAKSKLCFGKVQIKLTDEGKEGAPPRKEGSGGESKEG